MKLTTFAALALLPLNLWANPDKSSSDASIQAALNAPSDPVVETAKSKDEEIWKRVKRASLSIGSRRLDSRP